jgi:hypothetical protein
MIGILLNLVVCEGSAGFRINLSGVPEASDRRIALHCSTAGTPDRYTHVVVQKSHFGHSSLRLPKPDRLLEIHIT